MSLQDIILGVILILFGVWLTIRKIITYVRGKQGYLGYDAAGIALGLSCVACGIILIVKYW